MRTAAEVGEIALGVEGDLAVRRLDQLDLVRLALSLEAPPRFLARDLLAVPLAALGELLLHLRLDPLQIGLGDRLRELEVVVEAVRDRRPDRDLDAGVEPSHRLGEQVRGRVPEDGKRVGIVLVPRRQDLDLLPVLERQAQVLDVPIRSKENRLLRELGADRGRRVAPGRSVGKFKLGGVGKDDFHGTAGYFRAPTFPA